MCELAQGCSPLLLPLAARRCCCLELAAAAARRSAAAAEASALGAGAVGVGGCAQLRWSATGMRSVSSALLLAKRQQHLEACRCCSLLGFPPRLRPGRKTKDASRSVTCAAACLGCVSMSNGSCLVPRVTQCLEGHWVNMRPGAAVMAHLRRLMAVGCHRPLAQRSTSCCEVTRASSAVEYLQAGQSVLTEAPVTDLYFPAAHLTQEMWSGPCQEPRCAWRDTG